MSHLSGPLPNLSVPPDTSVLLPAKAALRLALLMIDTLEKKLRAEQLECESAGDEDGAQERQEDLMDLSITQKAIDPTTWAANRASEGKFSIRKASLMSLMSSLYRP